jgi:hypothetical protein
MLHIFFVPVHTILVYKNRGTLYIIIGISITLILYKISIKFLICGHSSNPEYELCSEEKNTIEATEGLVSSGSVKRHLDWSMSY